MKKIIKFGLPVLSAALTIGINQAAGGAADAGGNALTIYSTAQPGAIAPELYRNGGRGQTIPGYAVVRQQRDIELNRGRNDIKTRRWHRTAAASQCGYHPAQSAGRADHAPDAGVGGQREATR